MVHEVRRNKKRGLSPFSAGERGIALLIVVSLLTVVGIMGVSFAFSMFLETQATRQFVSTTQARYLAEGGVAYARALLDEDRLGSRLDTLTETWAESPQGADADVDGEGDAEARWWSVQDAEGATIGRYALRITDEGGKANLNAAQADPSSLELGQIHLTMLLEAAGLEDAQAVASAIEQYRYGPDGKPGMALVDDDGDGAVDEVEECRPLALLGDDRRIEGLEELTAIAGLSAEEIRALSRVATVYSWDLNVSVSGRSRVNVNTATAEELLAVLLEAGVADPWQAAVNMADYVDADLEMSTVVKASQVLTIPNQGTFGAWSWQADPEGRYERPEPGNDALEWTVSVPTGSFQILVRGMDGGKVGDVTLAGQRVSSVNDGELLGTFELSGVLTITVVHREPAGTTCAFRGIELVSDTPIGTGVTIRGIEAVRINELMVEPSITLSVASATFDPQNSDWVCPVGSPCTNSGVGQARWVWTVTTLPPGAYYLRVYGAASGQTVGEVRSGSATQLLVHGERHPATVFVGSDGKMTLTIGKTAADQTYYLQSIALSRQPDAEYLELINLSDNEIDVSGWVVDGEAAGGRQAQLPAGAIIQPRGLLVAAVDLDDAQEDLAGNDIDARSAWELGAAVDAVQLEFPGGAPSPDDDWLKTAVGGGSPPRLVLRSGEVVVDAIEYPLPLPTSGFQSLEKGNPSVVVDQDHDGLDEGWYPSLQLYTPGMTNDNEGLKEERDETTVVTHDPSEEITVRNQPLEGVGQLAGLPSGRAWEPFSSADLAKIVDRLTVEGLRLETEGALTGGSGWTETAEGYAANSSGAAGTWSWTGIPEGTYRLSLYGWSGEQLAVRWQLLEGSFNDWSPALSTDAQGRIVVGQVTVGLETTPATILTLEVQCASPGGVCHFDHASLDPQLLRVGPVNVNTAPLDVLQALPGMTEAMAQRIISGRPYGDKEKKSRGIGDLLVDETLGATEEDRLEAFRRLAHLLTTRSDVFEIFSLGQWMDKHRVSASQRVHAVIQR